MKGTHTSSSVKKGIPKTKQGKVGKAKKHRRQIRTERHEAGYETEEIKQVEDMMDELKKHHKVTHKNEHIVFRSAKKSSVPLVKILAESEHITEKTLGPALNAVDRETRSHARWFKDADMKSNKDQRRELRRNYMKHMVRLAGGPNSGNGNFGRAVKASKYAPLRLLSELAHQSALGEEGFKKELEKIVQEGMEIHYHRVKK